MRLVIDANIAQSAGTSSVPSAMYCRECLNAILEAEHVAVFTELLREEWSEHSSGYARRWRRSMSARRRIAFAEGIQFSIHLDRACACLERESSREDLRKDFHLVRAALASDCTILSCEKNFPKYVAIASRSVRVLSTLYYGNPVADEMLCIQWIMDGARPVRDRLIQVWVANH
jgi:hypothetical protein